MTLRDKIAQCPDQQGWTNPNYGRAENLEKISDDYAIEFADFVFWLSKREIGKEKQLFYNDKYKNIKQLLEIFKKEKGL